MVYFHFLWQQRQGSAFAQAALFLFGTTAALLGVRGFFWLFGEPAALGRLVFAAATLLPIAVSIFSEHLLRRHHPLALKLGALAVSSVFFIVNLMLDLPGNLPLLIIFLAGFLLVLASNGWLLLTQSHTQLSRNESQLARSAALAAVFALPLIVTDFREELDYMPVRLGALGPLILIYVLLHLTSASGAVANMLSRLLVLVASAGVLSLMFGVVTVGMGSNLASAWLHGMPVATAWMLLAAAVIQTRLLISEARSQNFLRWLLHARLDSVDGLLGSLKKLPLTAEHTVLRAQELMHYNVDQLFALAGSRREPLNLNEARTWVKAEQAHKLDAAEQLIDLLERHEMTHALLITREPPLIVLLNLPQGANTAVGEIRAGVIQRIARRITSDT